MNLRKCRFEYIRQSLLCDAIHGMTLLVLVPLAWWSEGTMSFLKLAWFETFPVHSGAGWLYSDG